jgi:biotin-(acetyl-CoA carboxylase) ligase
VRKLAGVLGETTGLGTIDPRAIVGIGTNVNWSRPDFPPDIADDMTSLSEAAGRSIDRDALVGTFLDDLGGRLATLRSGGFDGDEWQARQLTTDLPVRLELPDGRAELVLARGVDPATGGLIIQGDGRPRTILSGEIRHVRVAIADEQPMSSASGV